MNPTLQAIADEIADKIAAKAVSNPDPTKVMATDLAAILISMLNQLDTFAFKPIYAFEYGDEPTIDLLTQEEFNAYMMTKIGGTYTPPSGWNNSGIWNDSENWNE